MQAKYGQGAQLQASGAVRNAGSIFLDRVEFVFLAFFLIVMLRFSTGEADSESARALSLKATESGDTFKQIAYTFIFLCFTVLWVNKKGFAFPRSVSFAQVLLLIWILCSSFWAYEPAISFRRAVLLVFVFSSLAIAVDFLGPYRSINVLYKALATCVVLSLLLVFLFPAIGTHPATEVDQSIAGGWRGVFVHKNTAGAVIAMGSILFFHFSITRGRWTDWFFFSLTLAFVIASKAKTPAGLLLISLPLSLIYRLAWADLRAKALCIALTIIGLLVIFSAATGYSTTLYEVFTDPSSFTGRVAIWDTALRFWSDHVWLGSGYSSLWGVSEVPPIASYAKEPFLVFMTHSHSGYIEILATTGIPGFSLAVFSAVVIPFYQLMRMSGRVHIKLLALLFGLWIFGVMENFMETQLYTRDREIWIVFVAAILIIQQLAKESYSKGSRKRVVHYGNEEVNL
jgi:exopolysaccharide production protein ExoQ